MAVSRDFINYVLEQLAALEGLSTRRMFGAVGLYGEGAFFGLISSDVLYFKVGESNRADFEARGMGQFRPYKNRPKVALSFSEVPADVLEDAEECARWARRAASVARAGARRRA
jgi:DNA transformation protein